MKKAISVCLLTFCVISAFCQHECDCEEALNADLKNHFSFNNSSQFRSNLYEYYQLRKEGKSHEEAKKNLEHSGQAYYNAFNGWLNANDERTKEVFKLFEQKLEREQYISSESFSYLNASLISENQKEMYIECLKIDAEKSKTGIVYSILGTTSDIFTINVLFKNNIFTNIDFVTLADDAVFSNCDVIGGNKLKKGDTIRVNQSIIQILKTIDKTKPCYIALNFNELNTKAIEVNKQIENPTSPIGTIICSVLNYSSFLEANMLSNTADMSKAIWVPCDGRDIKNSRYGDFSGGKVPDLRGVFLRGINDFNVSFPSVSRVNEFQKNPENKAAGEFQEDSFEEHTHTLGDSGEADWEGSNPKNRQRVRNDGKGSGILTSSTGGDETRPKNVTVFYYIRIN